MTELDFPQAAEQLREFVNDSAEVKRRKQLPKPVKDREFLMKQDWRMRNLFAAMCSIAKMPPGRGRLCGRREEKLWNFAALWNCWYFGQCIGCL